MPPPEGTDNRSLDAQRRAAPSLTPTNLPQRIGKYKVESLLGTGGFGHVYRCHDSRIDRRVAIKVLRSDILTPATREQLVADFLHEAKSAAKVIHDFVCPILEVGEDGGLPYIVLPYCASGTLRHWMKANPLPPVLVALGLIRDVALGLHAAHLKGLVHRDVKPDNVLWDAERQRVLVADFGLAKVVDSTVTVSRIKGSPSYMSPEQWRPTKGQKLGPASDVFSLGVMLFQLLTGELPFDRPEDGNDLAYGMAVLMEEPWPPTALLPRLDSRLDALCLKALMKAPTDRYVSAKAFADALDELQKELEEAERFARAEIERRRQAEADYQQGEKYYTGHGVPQDYAKAYHWYEKAAAQGHASAQFVLGMLYMGAMGVLQDYAKAREWYEKAAAQGHASAQHNLGYMYERGLGVTRDLTRALEYYRAAARELEYAKLAVEDLTSKR